MQEKNKDFQPLLAKLQGALASIGPTELGNLLDCSSQEAGRKINGERGIILEDLAKALTCVGAQIITTDDIVVNRRKYESLLEWANDGMQAEREALRHIPKRAAD